MEPRTLAAFDLSEGLGESSILDLAQIIVFWKRIKAETEEATGNFTKHRKEDGTQAAYRKGTQGGADDVVRPQSVLRAYLATRRPHRPRLQVGGEEG